MKKLVVLAFLALLVGCAQPSFTHERCLTECNQCGLDCDTICAQLQAGIESTTCHDASQNVWLCAINNGCNFPTTCSEEVETFLTCEP